MKKLKKIDNITRSKLWNLKNIILNKRFYIDDSLKEKYDFSFNNYKYEFSKNIIQETEIRYMLAFKGLKKKKYRNKLFPKIFRKEMDIKIKNELLIMSPELLFLHIAAKSWSFIKGIKRKRRLKNVKKMVLRYAPNMREAYDLREQLKKTYFWLANTTKRQVLNSVKLNKLKQIGSVYETYKSLKKKIWKKKFLLLRRNKKIKFFLKLKNKIFLNMFNKFISILKESVVSIGLSISKFFFKFFFFKYFIYINFLFKRTLVFKSLKDGFNISLSEVLALKKRKFRLRRRIKRKLSFFYSLYAKKKKIFKLKTRMVNSNFFITLTDYNNNVLMYKSTGQVSENRKKKIKLSPAIVMKMMSPILYLLKKKRIKLLFICVNSKINRHINNVIKCLKKSRRIRILKILFSKPIAHHFGTRKPKLRRL